MNVTFEKITDYPRGTLYHMLIDAYAFNGAYRNADEERWRAHDDFFYDHPLIAEQYGFITAVDGAPVGHITWDPRNLPAWADIGHNCILTAYKGRGLGKLQLAEAVRRIQLHPVEVIRVSTNSDLLPAQRNYESVGFRCVRRERNAAPGAFFTDTLYYELTIARA